MQMKTETRVTKKPIHHPENQYALEEIEVSFQNLPRIPLLALIRLYQKFISPAIPGNTCRFYPTCSHYSYRAIYKYGVLRGSLLAIWRVLRCNPFTSGGHDPVP
jgi:hypothetical protein